MLAGRIDFYRFISFSLILTLLGDHEVRAKQNFLASFSHFSHNFSLIRIKSVMLFKLNIQILFLSEIQ